MSKLKHSYSSIAMFEQCARRYYYQRVVKSVVDPGSEASIYGNRVHKSLEDRLRDGMALPAELQKHEDKCVAIKNLGGNLTPEKELCATRDYVATGWWDEDVWFRGKLDVFVEKGKRAVILDWKTGKRKPNFFQLRLNALHTFMQYPLVKDISTGFVWLKDNLIDRENYTRDQLPAMVEELEEKIGRIEEAEELGVWQAKPGPLCGWCPAQDICEFADKRRRR